MPKRTNPLYKLSCCDCGVLFDVYHRFQTRCETCQVLYRNTRKKTYNLTCSKCNKLFRSRNQKTKKCPVCGKHNICKTCGNEYEKTSYQHRHYCSEKCSNLYKSELYFGGNYIATLERDGYKCVKCGSNAKLHVHHIDCSGRFKKTNSEICNNDIKNLLTLCNSCHQTLHTQIQYILTQKYTNVVIEITQDFLRSS